MNGSFAALYGKPRWLIFALAAVLSVAYAFFNLHAAWDPASNLANIRAGIVNEDKPVTSDGSKVAVGDELTKTLLDGKKFGWRTLSREQAEAQLRDGQLDFYLHIPSDASARVLGLPTAAKPERAILSVYANPAYNYPMHQIADTLAMTIREQLNGKVAAGYLEKLLGGIDSAVKGIGKAADGARQVADGTKAAGDGSVQLAEGMDKATDGAKRLSAGIDQVADGAGALAAGATRVANGNRQLADGLTRAEAGAHQLAQGSVALRDGAVKLVDGYGQIARGNEKLSAGLGRAVDGTRQIIAGVKGGGGDPVLDSAGAGIKESMKNLIIKKPYLYLDKDFRDLMHHLKVLSARADEVKKETVEKLTNALGQLETGLVQAQDGANQLAAGAWTGYHKGQEFVDGANRFQAGAAQLAEGVGKASAGARQLADGADQLAAGGHRLSAGTEQLRAGGHALADGMVKLQEGSHKLKDGMARLTDGTEQLATGLKSGANAAVPPRTNASAMSQPIAVKEAKTTSVPLPGEALLAVTLPTALWLGALLLVAVCRIFGLGWGTGETGGQRLLSMVVPGLALTGLVAGTAYALGPNIKHPLPFLVFCAVATFSFIAINQFLAHAFGVWGYVLSGILLIVMPVAVGTKAPYILLPGFYQKAAYVFPFTHAVRGIQSTVAGGANGIFWVSVTLLMAFLGLSVWVTRFISRHHTEPPVQQQVAG